MPIRSFTNYAGIEPQGSGQGDLIANMVEGYKAGRLPAHIKQEEAQKQALTKKLMQESEKLGLEMPYVAEKEAEALKKAKLGNTEQEMTNKIMEATGMDEARANILLKQMQAEEARKSAEFKHLAHLTETQKHVLQEVGNLDSPEAIKKLNEYKKQMSYSDEVMANAPETALPMSDYTPGERTAANAKKAKYQEQVNSWGRISEIIPKVEAILDKHPNMGGSLAAIAHNVNLGKNSKEYLPQILQNISDEKERAAVEIIDKYYNDIALELNKTQPGRGSNFLLQTIQSTKGSAKNLVASNRAINQSTLEQGAPWLAFKDDLTYARKHRLDIDFDRDYYVNKIKKNREGEILKKAQEMTPEQIQQQKNEQTAQNLSNMQNQPGGTQAMVQIEDDEGNREWVTVDEAGRRGAL